MVPAAGGELRALTSKGSYNYQLIWQPGGSKIVFERYQPDAGSYAVDAVTGGVPRRIGPLATAAAWALDGTAIALGRSIGLELVAPDGSGARVRVGNRNVADVAWSPNGQRIAFTVATPTRSSAAASGHRRSSTSTSSTGTAPT